ncbi:MAG TPA: hypothetical protein VF006_34010 [Longimicrobium sp.]
MTMRRMLAPCLAAMVLASPAVLQAQQNPEEVAQAYFAHFRAGEMDRVAALMHPRPLESFRTFMLQMMGEDGLDETPLAGRDDLATMPADSFFLAFTESAGAQEEFGDMFSTLEVQPLGHVAQGDSLAHVVYSARLEFMNQQAQQTTVLTLRRHRGTWLVDPGDGLMNMMGGGLMMLMMSAGMQAGILGGLDMDDDHDEDMDDDYDHDEEDDEDDDDEDDDEDEDDDDEDDDEDEDEDDDDPPAS